MNALKFSKALPSHQIRLRGERKAFLFVRIDIVNFLRPYRTDYEKVKENL
jgi:hypothetical protein